jgi:hypothetical protein
VSTDAIASNSPPAAHASPCCSLLLLGSDGVSLRSTGGGIVMDTGSSSNVNTFSKRLIVVLIKVETNPCHRNDKFGYFFNKAQCTMEQVLESIRSLFASYDDNNIHIKHPESLERNVIESGLQMTAKLEHEERKKLEDKKAKQNRPLVTRTVDAITEEECNSFIDDEMQRRRGKTKWHHLDTCFRWQKIQQYVSSLNFTDLESYSLLQKIKQDLRNNRLSKVVYNSDDQTITKLNIYDI